MSGKHTVPCPGCGAFIVMDDDTCTVRHPSPICSFFTATAARFNMKPRIEKWTEVVDRNTGEVLDSWPEGAVKGAGKA